MKMHYNFMGCKDIDDYQNQTKKEIIDSLMDRSGRKSALQIFDLKDLKNLVEQNYNLHVDLKQSKFRVRSVNHTYLIVTNRGKFVLRISMTQRYLKQSLEDLKFETEALNYLYSHNFPVIHPIKRKDGEFVAIMEIHGRKYYYILFSFASGQPIFELGKTHYYKIGNIIAKMHLQWDLWKPSYTRFAYNEETMFVQPIRMVEKYLGKEFPEYLTAINQFRDYAKFKLNVFLENNNNSQSQGIIHGDLHTFNMHFDGDEVTIFDFDFMGYGLRVFDIACFLNTTVINKSKEVFGINAKQSFLDGYAATRKLSIEEIKLIPTMKVIRAIITFGLWAHLIGTESFEEEHEKMTKYIIGLFKETISQVVGIIGDDQDY